MSTTPNPMENQVSSTTRRLLKLLGERSAKQLPCYDVRRDVGRSGVEKLRRKQLQNICFLFFDLNPLPVFIDDCRRRNRERVTRVNCSEKDFLLIPICRLQSHEIECGSVKIPREQLVGIRNGTATQKTMTSATKMRRKIKTRTRSSANDVRNNAHLTPEGVATTCRHQITMQSLALTSQLSNGAL